MSTKTNMEVTKMDKTKIDSNVEWAIRCMNEEYDFDKARRYIEAALLEVGSNKKIAYYDVLRNVLMKLHYNVRGFSKKGKVKESYNALLHYYADEFENICYAEIDADSEIEAGIVNSICCDITQNVGGFAKSMRQLYMDVGILTALANNNKYLNEYMPIILRTERAAFQIMRRYNKRSPEIDANIKIWEDEIKGKYGAKYL